MNKAEANIKFIKKVTGEAFPNPDFAFGADWDLVRQIPVFELREAVALSVDINLEFSDIEMKTAVLLCAPHESTFWLDEFNLFFERLTIASGNVCPYGKLPVVEANDDRQKCKVRLTDFAAWAKTQGWTLPEEFL